MTGRTAHRYETDATGVARCIVGASWTATDVHCFNASDTHCLLNAAGVVESKSARYVSPPRLLCIPVRKPRPMIFSMRPVSVVGPVILLISFRHAVATDQEETANFGSRLGDFAFSRLLVSAETGSFSKHVSEDDRQQSNSDGVPCRSSMLSPHSQSKSETPGARSTNNDASVDRSATGVLSNAVPSIYHARSRRRPSLRKTFLNGHRGRQASGKPCLPKREPCSGERERLPRRFGYPRE